MNESLWIIKPFNGVFFVTLACFALLLIAGTLLLRKRKERTRQLSVVIACVLTLAGFFVYKYFLSIDPQFKELNGGFNWWDELPLHLCNINLILIPIAVLTRKKPLLGFCFFVGPLGALFALIMPDSNFSGFSLLLPRMIGYYGTHFMVIVAALSLVTLRLYRPRFKDLPFAVIALAAVALVVFGINALMRLTGVNPAANYFYTWEPLKGVGLLEMFYRWIPIPYLYMLPCIAIMTLYMVIVTIPFAIADGIRRK